jgi:hypothetical protein
MFDIGSLDQLHILTYFTQYAETFHKFPARDSVSHRMNHWTKSSRVQWSIKHGYAGALYFNPSAKFGSADSGS